MTKTIYLIRHAESDENRRRECLKTSMQGLGKLKLPRREDVVASMELMNVSAQLDTGVSPRGQSQIDQLGERIAKDDFVRKMGIELVAHSPLQRARQTSYGMLQCVAPASSSLNNNKDNTKNENTKNNDPTIKGSIHPSVKRVVELDILSERTPIEWLPIQHDAYTRRIAEFEIWLSQQPEEVIAVVGHSLYFKNMLGLSAKFHNVDVWSLQFDFTVENSVQKVRRDVNVANEVETKKKMMKHFENLGNMMSHKKKKKNGSASDNSSTSESSSGGHSYGGGSHDKNGSSTHHESFSDNVHSQNDNQTNASSCNVDSQSDRDTGIVISSPLPSISKSQKNRMSSQTEIDGICLGSLKLPRGWRELKHHYRYDPNYTS